MAISFTVMTLLHLKAISRNKSFFSRPGAVTSVFYAPSNSSVKSAEHKNTQNSHCGWWMIFCWENNTHFCWIMI